MKGCGRNWPWPVLRHCPSIYVDGLRKATWNVKMAEIQNLYSSTKLVASPDCDTYRRGLVVVCTDRRELTVTRPSGDTRRMRRMGDRRRRSKRKSKRQRGNVLETKCVWDCCGPGSRVTWIAHVSLLVKTAARCHIRKRPFLSSGL